MERYELVSRIVKTRGLEGKVTARAAADLPFCVYEGLRVHVVPPTLRGPRQLTVDGVGELADGVFTLSFSQVAGVEAASELAGRYLLAAAADLDVDADALPEAWVGRNVCDEALGVLGTVRELIETPAHDVWVLDGPHGEVLVPVVDEFVLDVPEDEALPIRVKVPEGLVGL